MGNNKGEVLRSERIYEGSVLNLRVDHTRLTDGLEVRREIVEHRGAVAIVPLDGEDNVHLVRQHRPAVDLDLLEIPAGGLEADETPHDSARRELQEEIGMYPEKLDLLGSLYPVPGYGSEVLHMFLARDLRPAELTGDVDEDITVERVSLDTLVDWIDRGKITDMKTVAGVLWVMRYLGRTQAG